MDQHHFRIVGWIVLVTLGLPLPTVLSDDSPDGSEKPVDKVLYSSLRDVINKGADLYNAGDPAACYRLFEGSLISIKPLLTHRPEVQQQIEKGLTEAERDPVVWRRAFTLRSTLDKVRNGINPNRGKKKEPEKPPIPETKKEDNKQPVPIPMIENKKPTPMPKKEEKKQPVPVPKKEEKKESNPPREQLKLPKIEEESKPVVPAKPEEKKPTTPAKQPPEGKTDKPKPAGTGNSDNKPTSQPTSPNPTSKNDALKLPSEKK